MAGVLEDHAGRLAGPAGARVAEMADFFRFLDERMPLLYSEWRAGHPGTDSSPGPDVSR
jgi:hypothetical protein